MNYGGCGKFDTRASEYVNLCLSMCDTSVVQVTKNNDRKIDCVIGGRLLSMLTYE